MASLANMQSQTELRRAQTGEAKNNQILQQQQAQKNKLELDKMQKWQEVLRNQAAQAGVHPNDTPSVNDVPGSLEFMSNLALRAQDPEKAAELAGQAAQIRQRQMAARTNQLRGNQVQVEAQKKQLDMVSQLMDSVKDDDSLSRANAIIAATTGQASPFAGRKYAEVKGVIEQLRDGAMTHKQKVDENIKLQEQISKEENRKDMIRHRQFQDAQAAALRPLKEAELKRKAKSGGKSIGEPTTKNIELTYMDLKEAHPDVSQNELMQKARAIESQTKALMLANRGLTADDARRQAKQGISMQPGVTYQDGSSASLALPPPPDRNFEVGKFYAAPNGGVYEYLGGGKARKVETAPVATGLELANESGDDETPPDDAE